MRRRPTTTTVLLAVVAVLLAACAADTAPKMQTRGEPIARAAAMPEAVDEIRSPMLATAHTAAALTDSDLEAAEFHCYFGIPEVEGEDVLILNNEGYMVGYSEEKEIPLWVCYQLFAVGDADSFPRLPRFLRDNRTLARTVHNDYTNSGYDRGHMAPSSGIGKRYGQNAQRETFLMTNISPQLPTLNQETWEALERRVSNEYAEVFENVWVAVGPIFFEDEPCIELLSTVRVPDAFFKIIVAEIDGEVEMLAIVMDQDVTGRRQIRTLAIRTVRDIEQLTSIEFFHELPDDEEDEAETSAPDAAWETNRMLIPTFDGRERATQTQACDD